MAKREHPIVEAAYRVSDEVGNHVEAIIKSGGKPTSKQLDKLRELIRLHFGEPEAAFVYEILVYALVKS